MNGERLGYFSYLLRLWQTSDRDGQIWRASLDNPITRERLGFENLEDLYEFLNKQLEISEKERDVLKKMDKRRQIAHTISTKWKCKE